MTKIKTSVLVGLPLDWAAAKCDMPNNESGWLSSARARQFSGNAAEGMPLIERAGISLIQKGAAGLIETELDDVIAISETGKWSYGPNMLIAGIRCLVASTLGDEIEVPVELVDDLPFNHVPIKTDIEFTNTPGELGGLWGQIGDAENALAEKLRDLPQGAAVILDEDVWFLIVEDGHRVLCIGQLQEGVVQNVHCRFDFGLDYVDVAADDLREAIERVKRATEIFNTVGITSYHRVE